MASSDHDPGSAGPSRASLEEIGQVFRQGSGRATASLVRIVGDLDVAEDAVQDAFVLALERWRVEGIPASPVAWIVTTGRNRAIDRLRRESLGRSILADMIHSGARTEEEPEGELDPMGDDALRLIFTCCHPLLAREAQVALTLRLLGGLSTEEVARAFLVEASTMAQRLVRAKRKIKVAQVPYRVPEGEELTGRLRQVLAVVYLIYNAGGSRTTAGRDGKVDLCVEALRLGRLLHGSMPRSSESRGLLALLLLTESRRGARVGADGSIVLLRDQVRGDWNGDMIAEAAGLLGERGCHPGAGVYELQARIQGVHAGAETFEDTDWVEIVRLYGELYSLENSPVVAMNRAIAVGEVEGPGAALGLIEGLPLSKYYLFHATRADLLRRLGRFPEAAEAYGRAIELAPSEAEVEFMRQRMESMVGD